MKKTYLYSLFARYLTLLILALLSTNLAWGETYTISFAKGTTNGTNISTLLNSQATTTICSSGGDNISSYSSTNCYYNTSGCGLRLAKSGGAGSLTLTFSDGIQSATIKEVIIYASAVASGNTLEVTPAGTVTTKTTFNSLSTYSTQAEINTYAQTAIPINGTLTSLTFGAISKKYVHLHQIDIVTSSTPSTEPNLSVSPTAIDFGTVYQDAEVGAQDVTVTFANLTINDVTAAISGSAFSINKTGSFTSGDKITITPNTANLGEYSETLTVSATGVDDQKVTVTMNVVKAPTLETYNKVTSVDDLADGDVIVLASSTEAYGVAPTDGHTYIDAMKFAGSQSASLKDNVLKAIDAYELTLAKSGENWTMTGADGLVGTTAAKTMTFGSTVSGNVTTWSISIDGSANASITSTTSSYGTIKYNSGAPRFLNYASGQTAIQIYKKGEAKTLSSIAVTTLPEKKVYKVGESFDATGLVVKGTYSDGSTKELTPTQYSLSTRDMSSAGQKTVTVSATDEIKTTFTIDVVALDKIEITTPPTTTAYNEGDNFDAAGMVVKATWGAEEGKMITDNNLTGYTVKDGNNLQPNQTFVTISYTHEGTTKTTTQEITVTAAANKYAVTFESDTEEGTLTVKVGDDVITSGDELVEGVTVSLTSTPKDGYKQQATPFVVKDADGGDVKVSKSGDVYSFAMPTKAVIITAKFVAVYAINVADDIQGGTIAIQDKDGNPITETSKGSKVVIAVTPVKHYSLKSLECVKEGTEERVDIDESEGEYSFTMPASAVSVTATFAEDTKYTVQFCVDGKITISDPKYAGELVKFPSVTPKEGYTFMGWTAHPIASTQQTAPEYVENLTQPEDNDGRYFAVFAVKEGEDAYKKVTSVTDGEYLIVNEASKRAFNGNDAANGYVTVSISNSEIEDPNGAAILEIKSMTGGYSLEITNGENANKFIYGKSGSNTIEYGNEAVANEITISDGAATILSNSTSFRYNASSGQDRFRYYKTTTTGASYILPALYKKQSATYSDYCTFVTPCVPITINDCGNASFCADVDLDFTGMDADDVEYTIGAYIGRDVVNGETAKLNLVGIDKVPARTGIFVIGDPGIHYVPIYTGGDLKERENSLTGTLESYTVKESDNIYALSKKYGDLRRVTPGVTIGAGKAYYEMPKSAGAVSVLTLAIVDEPTGVEEIKSQSTVNGQQSTAIYNLQGMRVATPKKGEVYIMNGKKFLMK